MADTNGGSQSDANQHFDEAQVPHEREETADAVTLLRTAIDKRRELATRKKDRDLRRELLHASLIRHLCKALGESRKKRRRRAKAKSFVKYRCQGVGNTTQQSDEPPALAAEPPLQGLPADRPISPASSQPTNLPLSKNKRTVSANDQEAPEKRAKVDEDDKLELDAFFAGLHCTSQ